MGTIILMRSGSTEFDEQDRIVGQLDIPLSVRGQAELGEAARELHGLSIDTIYAAAGEAARQSAELLAERLGVRVKIVPDLTNINLGLWQGLPVEEVRRKHPRAFRQWEESPCDVCPPAGETVDHVLERLRHAIKPVLRRAMNETVVLVAPDPLRQVIRCWLQKTNVAHLLEDEPSSTRWQAIEIA